MKTRLWMGVAGVAGAAVLATGGAALATDQLGTQTPDTAVTVGEARVLPGPVPPGATAAAADGAVVISEGELDLSPQDQERLEELEAQLDREVEALEKAEPGIAAEIERIEGELDSLLEDGPKEPSPEQEARAERLFEQLDRQFELAEQRQPERVERISAIEEQIEELLPFDEECFDEHGEGGDEPDDEPDDADSEDDGEGDATT
mgnify:FL=1